MKRGGKTQLVYIMSQIRIQILGPSPWVNIIYGRQWILHHSPPLTLFPQKSVSLVFLSLTLADFSLMKLSKRVDQYLLCSTEWISNLDKSKRDLGNPYCSTWGYIISHPWLIIGLHKEDLT